MSVSFSQSNKMVLARNCLFRETRRGKVFVYVCGMTAHDLCHVGHIRMLVAFDVMLSWLREIGHLLFFVRNISDFDDKILAKLQSITHFQTWVKRMEWNLGGDGLLTCALQPNLQPKASSFFNCILRSIRRLVKKKAAYLTLSGNVYFMPPTSPTLVRQEMVQSEGGSFGDKKSVKDFAVWKAIHNGDKLMKASPYSLGKPGWHAECSTMCCRTFRTAIDLHGGGEDLKHPHHYNERQQNDIIVGPNYIRHWVHNGLVFMGGSKMSNSVNNIIRARCLFRRFHPEVVRFYILCSHYKSSFQFNKDSLVQAERILLGFYRILPGAQSSLSDGQVDWSGEKAKLFKKSMNCDFNTPEAVSILISSLKNSSTERPNTAHPVLRGLARALGILNSSTQLIRRQTRGCNVFARKLYIDSKLIERCKARAEGDYFHSDKVRSCLKALGVAVADAIGWSTWS